MVSCLKDRASGRLSIHSDHCIIPTCLHKHKYSSIHPGHLEDNCFLLGYRYNVRTARVRP